MESGASTTLTIYHDGQFWVGLVEQVEGDQLSAARIVFGKEPPDQKILDLVASRRWDELPLSASVEVERSQKRQEEKQVRFEQRAEKRKQKKRGH